MNYSIDFCIARPIRFVVGLALNTYDDDDDDDERLARRSASRPRRERNVEKTSLIQL